MTLIDNPTSHDRSAVTSAPIHPALAARWSPRSFRKAEPIDEALLTAALEAARWAPSANNSQPSRFIVARRGSRAFGLIEDALRGFNKVWAGSASVLLVAVVETADAEGKPQRYAEYDLGQALAHLTVQAHNDGLHVHQMAGFDAAVISAAFSLPERLTPFTVTAIGTLDTPDALPDEALRSREVAPRTRIALDRIVLIDE
jgi:nitroreductase